MRAVFTIFCLILLSACQQNQSLPIIESSAEKTPEKIQLPQVSLESLTKEQKQSLDESLPPKVREMLDKAEKLEVLVNLDKTTKKQKEIFSEPGNTIAKITDSSLKKAILDSFYFDTIKSRDGESKACWNPRHRLIAKHQGKTVDILICFECGHYEVSGSFGEISGSLGAIKSLPLIDEVIEKYGVDVQPTDNVLPIRWKKSLDEFISPTKQETFENAEKLIITTQTATQNPDKTKGKRAIISEQSEKKYLLDFIYKSAGNKRPPVDCKDFFQNSIEAEYKGKKAKIEFELFCGYLLADGRALADKNEFAKIISNLIEKYGVDVQ